MPYEKEKLDFSKVISYSQDISNPRVDRLFERWVAAKSKFIALFGNKLVYECPGLISFELTDNQKMELIDDFISAVLIGYRNDDLAHFLEDTKDCFFSNTLDRKYICPDTGEVIPKGMKILRAFKYFEKDKEILSNMQTQASRILQENKLEGTLCFSVHPLDFLSSSENNHNWRSCQSLDGDYRSGNLSYMVDSATVICYLKTNSDVQLYSFPDGIKWNSKKWRMLLFFSDDLKTLFAGRQYPLEIRFGLDYILSQGFPQIGLSGPGLSWKPWSKVIPLESSKLKSREKLSYVSILDKFFETRNVVMDASEKYPLHFNDLLYSKTYQPFYSYRSDIRLDEEELCQPLIIVGGEVECLSCGKNMISEAGLMICDDCEEDT